MRRGSGTRMRGWLWVCLLTALCLPAAAQRAKDPRGGLEDLATARPETRVVSQNVDLNEIRAQAPQSLVPLTGTVDAFLTAADGPWTVMLDRLTGRPALMEGRGIPWIPGTANDLTPAALGWRSPVVEPDVVAKRALDFLATYPDLYGVDVRDLMLNEEASGPLSDYLYFLDFDWTYHGIPVEGAHIVFRLNHGNLVQMGQEFVSPAIERLDPNPTLSLETAWQILYGYIGSADAADKVLDQGHLLVLPVMTAQALSGASVEPGTGIEYRLAYVMSFRRAGEIGTWEARVDAHSGEILSFMDTNDYGKIHGGVYPGDRPSAEADRPMPFADTGQPAPNNYADAGGLFTGNNATTTLNGKYVTIQDKCGAIGLSTVTGDISLGSGAGTDCSTPGVGGAGNTHAARTQYYQVTLIKMKALTYLPSNAWLQGQVLDKTNLTSADSSYCPGNAWWDGSGVNFCVGSASYGNTGELPGVSLHEWGHGMDSNDGMAPADKGTGETYGDFTAALQTHNSCLGNGFFLSGNCSGYGNACLSCSGIRDIDYAAHASATPALPTQLNGSTGYRCSTSATYYGPCGYEGHCESYISSEALWDLATRDLVTWGLDLNTAWLHVDKLWYRSRSTAGAAYACPSLATTNGCGAANFFSVFRVIDDDDGNLANGTPHASAIYAAFNRHAIACSTVVNTDSSTCPTIAAPTLLGSSGSNSNTLTWNSVSGAASYDVYRNETSCDAGYTRIATTGSTGYVDNAAIDGLTYYYRVQAIGTSQACFSPMTNCMTLTPSTPAGIIMGNVTALAGGAPVSGALVSATDGVHVYQTTANLSGQYVLSGVIAGTYSATASKYGFLPSTVNGIGVTAGVTTTQNFVLATAPSHVVSGTVSDSVTGWPLYASVVISGAGYPGSTLWTDPVTGFYSATLVDGITYTLAATAWVGGYDPGSATAAPSGSDLTRNIALASGTACGAPGYSPSAPLASQNWDTGVTPPALPTGWLSVLCWAMRRLME